MIIQAGKFRIAAGKKEAAIPELRAMVEATRAEPGCVAYEFAFDMFDDHVLRVFELYADETAVEAHRNSPHMARMCAVMGDIGITDRDIASYDATRKT